MNVPSTRLRVFLKTIGCRANQADSADLARALDPSRVEVVGELAAAELIVINTCCVTAEAERDCRKAARKAKSSAPAARVVLTGCAVSAIPGFGRDLGVEVELRGGGDTPPEETAAWINDLAAERVDRNAGTARRAPTTRTRALLKVQTGCSHGCSYCVVPQARGKERSLALEEVLDRAERLLAEGFAEVVLTGVQLGAWGRGLPGRPRLPALVEAVADRVAPGRVRLSSIEPWSVDEELIAVIAGHDRVCPHLHVPLQSGDDGVLAAMKRGYTADDYRVLVERARSAIPHLALGTDVLCGFPGETPTAHQRTLDLLGELEPSYIHAFPYSPRPGTRAAALEDGPSRETARERVRETRELGAKLNAKFRARQVGAVREVIVEERRGGEVRGMSDNYIPVRVEIGEASPGDLIACRLEPGDDARMFAIPSS